jgi:predicted ArsR family transcriptional regulator
MRPAPDEPAPIESIPEAMESTRDQILGLLRGNGGATVVELAEALAMSPAAVRRHLDGLRAEGFVDVKARRHPVGRPSFAFYLTERAEERDSTAYSRLLLRMFRELAELRQDEVSGQGGHDVLDKVFEGIAARMAQEHRPEVMGVSLEEKVVQLSEALKAEGILDAWSREADGYRLLNSSCPYRRAAETTRAPCRLDRMTIQLLLGVPVEQVGRVVDGHPYCEYVVQPKVVSKRSRQGGADSRRPGHEREAGGSSLAAESAMVGRSND